MAKTATAPEYDEANGGPKRPPNVSAKKLIQHETLAIGGPSLPYEAKNNKTLETLQTRSSSLSSMTSNGALFISLPLI